MFVSTKRDERGVRGGYGGVDGETILDGRVGGKWIEHKNGSTRRLIWSRKCGALYSPSVATEKTDFPLGMLQGAGVTFIWVLYHGGSDTHTSLRSCVLV